MLVLYVIWIVGNVEKGFKFFGVEFESFKMRFLEESDRCGSYGFEDLFDFEDFEVVDEVIGVVGGLLVVEMMGIWYYVRCFYFDFYNYVKEWYNEFVFEWECEKE